MANLIRNLVPKEGIVSSFMKLHFCFFLLALPASMYAQDDVIHFSFPVKVGNRDVQMGATVECSDVYGGWGVRIGKLGYKDTLHSDEIRGHVYLPDSVIVPDGRRLAIKWTADGSFQNCIHITGVRLPEPLVYLSVNTFRDCKSLREITIPAETKHIFPFAFAGCDSLRRITFLPLDVPRGFVEQNFNDRYKRTATLVMDARAAESYMSSVLCTGFHYHAELIPRWTDSLEKKQSNP